MKSGRKVMSLMVSRGAGVAARALATSSAGKTKWVGSLKTDQRSVGFFTQDAAEVKVLSQEAQREHLILYFDLNGTIMTGDAASGKSVDDCLWQMLGESYSAQWSSSEPQQMTFRQFVDTVLHPGNNSNEVTKKNRNAAYAKFYDYLLEHKHPLTSEILNKFNLLKKEMGEGNIYHSFIKLIDYLEKNKDKYTYTICFRTFGQDLKLIAEELQQKTSLKVDACAEFKEANMVTNEGKILTTSQQIYQWVQQFKVCAVQDTWSYWNKNNQTHYFGKIFPFHKPQGNQLEIFFDDNAARQQILTAAPVYGEAISQTLIQAKLMNQGQIVPVNSLLAATDDNYYIDLVELGRKKRSELLQEPSDKQQTLLLSP